MNGNETIIQVLDKYRLRWPVPQEVRGRIRKAKIDTLPRILKEQGRFTGTARLLLSLYQTMRGMGFDITFRQGRMISSALAAIVVCALFTGAFVVTRPILFPEHEIRGVVIFAMGDVNRVRADGTSAPLKVKDLLDKGDTIRTGDGSTALVQVGDNIMVRLQSQGEASVSSLIGDPDLALAASRGTLLAKLGKLSKGRSFSAKLPTIIAAVRGTSFSVSSGKYDTVAVAEGSVMIKSLAAGTEAHLKEGSAVDAIDDLKERPATNIEKLQIERITRIPFMENPQKASDAELLALADLVRKIDSEIDSQTGKLQEETIPGTLQEIRARYGRIDVVNLYSGETVRGAILNRGEMIKMVVPGNYRFIPRNKVRNTSVE